MHGDGPDGSGPGPKKRRRANHGAGACHSDDDDDDEHDIDTPSTEITDAVIRAALAKDTVRPELPGLDWNHPSAEGVKILKTLNSHPLRIPDGMDSPFLSNDLFPSAFNLKVMFKAYPDMQTHALGPKYNVCDMIHYAARETGCPIINKLGHVRRYPIQMLPSIRYGYMVVLRRRIQCVLSTEKREERRSNAQSTAKSNGIIPCFVDPPCTATEAYIVHTLLPTEFPRTLPGDDVLDAAIAKMKEKGLVRTTDDSLQLMELTKVDPSHNTPLRERCADLNAINNDTIMDIGIPSIFLPGGEREQREGDIPTYQEMIDADFFAKAVMTYRERYRQQCLPSESSSSVPYNGKEEEEEEEEAPLIEEGWIEFSPDNDLHKTAFSLILPFVDAVSIGSFARASKTFRSYASSILLWRILVIRDIGTPVSPSCKTHTSMEAKLRSDVPLGNGRDPAHIKRAHTAFKLTARAFYWKHLTNKNKRCIACHEHRKINADGPVHTPGIHMMKSMCSKRFQRDWPGPQKRMTRSSHIMEHGEMLRTYNYMRMIRTTQRLVLIYMHRNGIYSAEDVKVDRLLAVIRAKRDNGSGYGLPGPPKYYSIAPGAITSGINRKAIISEHIAVNTYGIRTRGYMGIPDYMREHREDRANRHEAIYWSNETEKHTTIQDHVARCNPATKPIFTPIAEVLEETDPDVTYVPQWVRDERLLGV